MHYNILLCLFRNGLPSPAGHYS